MEETILKQENKGLKEERGNFCIRGEDQWKDGGQ
jgi:hypothetical protein